MKKYIIEEQEVHHIDLEEEFEGFDGIKIVVNGLRNFNGINENFDFESITSDKTVYPLYATIHSGVYFQVGTNNLSKWDSGQAGYVIVDKDYPMEEIKYHIERLNSIYNGWYREVVVVEQDICDCCDNVKSSEFIDGWLCFTEEEKEQARKYFKKEYDIND